jgi:DNA-binding NarL/FixJ family response regulator
MTGIDVGMVSNQMERLAFSPRQRAVAWRLIAGERNAAIAEALAIEPSTVKNHIHEVYCKAGISTGDGRTHATAAIQLLRVLHGLPPKVLPARGAGEDSA